MDRCLCMVLTFGASPSWWCGLIALSHFNNVCPFIQVPWQSADMTQRDKDPFLALPAQHAEEDTVVWRWIACGIYGLEVLWYYRGSILSSSLGWSGFDYLVQMLSKDSDTASFFISNTLWSAWDLGNSHRFINDPDFLSLCFPLFLWVVQMFYHLENNYGIRQQKDPFPSCISTSFTISGMRKRNESVNEIVFKPHSWGTSIYHRSNLPPLRATTTFGTKSQIQLDLCTYLMARCFLHS